MGNEKRRHKYQKLERNVEDAEEININLVVDTNKNIYKKPLILAAEMNISGLLEFYRKVRLKDGKIELCDRYIRGPASLAPIKGELLYNRIPMSPFDMQLVVM